MRTIAHAFVFAIVIIGSFVSFASHAVAQKKPPPKKLPSQKFKGYGLPAPVKTAPTQSMQVARVDAARKSEARATAAKIDALVEANLAKHKLKPNEPANDYTFVRRAHLDITGHSNSRANQRLCEFEEREARDADR